MSTATSDGITQDLKTTTGWTRKGECRPNCGHCCKFIGNMEHVVKPDDPSMDHDFCDAHEYRRDPDGTRRRVLQLYHPCQYLREEDNRCNIFDDRPKMCHDWPNEPRGIQNIPCSYYFERSDMVKGKVMRWGGSESPYPGLKTYDA
jgi:Fe-S-cluster containining protein